MQLARVRRQQIRRERVDQLERFEQSQIPKSACCLTVEPLVPALCSPAAGQATPRQFVRQKVSCWGDLVFLFPFAYFRESFQFR